MWYGVGTGGTRQAYFTTSRHAALHCTTPHNTTPHNTTPPLTRELIEALIGSYTCGLLDITENLLIDSPADEDKLRSNASTRSLVKAVSALLRWPLLMRDDLLGDYEDGKVGPRTLVHTPPSTSSLHLHHQCVCTAAPPSNTCSNPSPPPSIVTHFRLARTGHLQHLYHY